MAGSSNGIAKRIRHLLQPAEANADSELLARFVDDRDGEAFALLVCRHGPMVHGVCRRVLRNEADADDAFQATFLVLARRAAVVRPRSLLTNWLYGVAYRTALEARRASAIRQAKERTAAGMKNTATTMDESVSDLREMLDRELTALPDRYRVAIVLCDLEGLSRKDAALRLGWAEGTLSSRLARARGLLATRLSRHGLSMPVAGLGVLTGTAAAGVPAKLVESTARIGILVAAGESVAVAPALVVALTEGVMKAMLLSKLKGMAAAVVVVCAVLVSATAGWQANTAGAADKQPPSESARKKVRDPDKERIKELELERELLLKELRELKDRLAKLEVSQSELSKVKLLEPMQSTAGLRGSTSTLGVRGNGVNNSAMNRYSGGTLGQTGLSQNGTLTNLGSGPLPPAANNIPVTEDPTKLPTGEEPSANGKLLTQVYRVSDLAQDEKQADALIRVLRKVVAPLSWDTSGGPGAVEYLATGESLVIRNKLEAHKDVAELLVMLRNAAKDKK